MALSYRSGGKPNPDSGLPLSVENYLRHGVAEGGRNHALFAAAAQLRDIDMPHDEALGILLPRATQDGLSASEASSTIESAFRGQKREAPVGKNGASRLAGGGGSARIGELPSRPSKGVYRLRERGARGGGGDSGGGSLAGSAWTRATNVPLPERIEEGFEELLLAAFEEGEGVCVGGTFLNEAGEVKPDAGVTLSREQWVERVRQRGGDFARVHTSRRGHFIRVNPMRIAADSKHSDADVSKYRHVLVEFDLDSEGRPIKKERQLGAILSSNLPVTAVIDSGGKSIHAWVRVDAANLEEYKERAAEVYEIFGGEVDSGNSNPSRYSRCPDGIRTVGEGDSAQEVRQALLATKKGAASWSDWKQTSIVQALGETWKPMRDLENYDIENDLNTVLGKRWLCKGGSLMVVAPSGVGKSSINMQLAIGWAIGRHDMTFGIKPVRALRQVVVQNENDQGDVAEAWQDVTRSFGLSHAEKLIADEMLTFKRVTAIVGDDFIDKIEALVQLHRPDICWIDPLLAYIGDDISKAEVISKFCYEGLSSISLKTGVIFAVIHHTGKPKDDRTRGSQTATDLAYAGLGSSHLTNWAREVLVLSRIKTADENDPATFSLTATKRRTRAGMISKPVDGDPLEEKLTASIYVRHGQGGKIWWEQCPEPEKPKGGRPKGEKREPKEESGPKRAPGRPSSLSAAQKREIVATAAEHGGRIPTGVRNALSMKLGKSMVTITRYLQKIEEAAALMGCSVQDALEQDVADDPAEPGEVAEKPVRMPYRD